MERTFGEIIKKERNDRDWSVRDFITKLSQLGAEVSPTYITKIEVHGEIPKPELICKIAELFALDYTPLLEAAKKNKMRTFEQLLTKKYENAVKLYRTQKD